MDGCLAALAAVLASTSVSLTISLFHVRHLPPRLVLERPLRFDLRDARDFRAFESDAATAWSCG